MQYTGSVFTLFIFATVLTVGTGSTIGKQTWGYVEVRPGANMFWWLYYYSPHSGDSNYTSRPLIIWLQGGPGASSTGYGNFEEIGPLDVNLKNRTDTWVSQANVLFIDNPVGSGFSYVNDTKLLCTNNTQIARDLLTMTKTFLRKVPEFQTVPLYIFSESYGGKMAAQFAIKLVKEITKGKVKCNFKGVALGDSWISPADSVLTWAPYLFSTSMVDTGGFAAINASAYKVLDAVQKGDFKSAAALWEQAQEVVASTTNGVNWYNILAPDNADVSKDAHKRLTVDKYPRVIDIINQVVKHVGNDHHYTLLSHKDHGKKGPTTLSEKLLKPYHSDPLSNLMNGPIKKTLRIVPDSVTWGGQADKVFQSLGGDFMTPVVKIVENLLNNTNITVNVYSGQLDLIVDTMGTIQWVQNMNWAGLKGWLEATRNPIVINNSTEMFIKAYKNFGFYWILKAGHMVPQDAPETAIDMMKRITKLK